MSQIKMVISDFGGVLTTPLVEAFASVQDRVGIPPKTFGEALRALNEREGTNPLFELECGRITEKEFQVQLADGLEPLLGHRPEIEDFGLLLFEALDPNPGMIDLIREVRRDGIRTSLLTNNVKEWEVKWRSMMPIDELFETVVDSAFVGCRKPDPRIYNLTLERVGLDPEECIFIDDMKINIDAANELGLHGVHFRETAQVRAEVHDLLA
ncbi:MAG TPA: HAD family phosphatase [Solirubrobacterales bacterium]|jgi:epoxide hydrolase-like predicted phosphatase|nr:HAD family phosphatase [Solirubrobacterales bacterium]HMW44770.1 HAD family phosphatase [Solirubrobacterales bacterium]HMX71040.1 HAD family phosphatase [Solirubrobacterales bacterium]HMY26539.1 HAD family phosphatase [Solirubrobacterales bacterium]HNA24848.1 HAD family phosphatase [Solirubrobacterales bacterium]